MKNREALIEFLATHWLDSMSNKDLETFFYDIQTDYLQSYSDEELIGEIEDVMSEEDFHLFITETKDET
jgi:LmbE family N-acetylglucosaminyl deacetylase